MTFSILAGPIRGRRASASRSHYGAGFALVVMAFSGLVPGKAQDAPAAPAPTPAATLSPAATTTPGATPLPPPSPGIGRLIADSVRYAGDLVIAEATNGHPVRFEGANASISANKITLDTAQRTVQAEGEVLVERQILTNRNALRPPNLVSKPSKHVEPFTETLRGNSFNYDFAAQQGHLDNARIVLAGFDITAAEIIIQGQRYTARHVILRPGGLTEAERRIYGTPPFNLRANEVTIEPSGRTTDRHDLRAVAKGAALYYNNFRLLPVPSYVLRTGLGASRRDRSAFTITPRVSFNSVDRFLLTTRLRFPLSRDAAKLALNTDIGASARVGFRGGVDLENNNPVGNLLLRVRGNDVITTQLTNRIELNRTPEVQFNSRILPLFNLPGGQRAGVGVTLESGRYTERIIDNQSGAAGGTVRSPREAVTVGFTTRATGREGPYLELFARDSHYSSFGLNYRNAGFEVGYEGVLAPRVNGLVSYRSTSLSGRTPFRFDQVEIARELRTTLDLQATPRYIVPLDLRYDLDQRKLRDKTFGLLRSYKTFAYGVVYQAAHRDVRLEVRQAF